MTEPEKIEWILIKKKPTKGTAAIYASNYDANDVKVEKEKGKDGYLVFIRKGITIL